MSASEPYERDGVWHHGDGTVFDNQEIARDADKRSFVTELRDALRSNPDAVAVGDTRPAVTINAVTG